MVFTEQDTKDIRGVVNTQDKKELIIRMFAAALIQGTNVTAPEMRSCLQTVINTLKDPVVVEDEGVKKKDRAV